MTDKCSECGAERTEHDVFADDVTNKVLDIVEDLIRQRTGETEGDAMLPYDWCAAMLDGLMQGVVEATFHVAQDPADNREGITDFLQEALELCIESTFGDGKGVTVQ